MGCKCNGRGLTAKDGFCSINEEHFYHITCIVQSHVINMSTLFDVI